MSQIIAENRRNRTYTEKGTSGPIKERNNPKPWYLTERSSSFRTFDEKTTRSSHIGNSGPLDRDDKLEDIEADDSQINSFAQFTNIEHSFQNTLSPHTFATGSFILRSDQKMDSLFSPERLSFEQALNESREYNSTNKIPINIDHEALRFHTLKIIKRSFLKMKTWSDNRIAIQHMFLDYYEIQRKKTLVDLVLDMNKLSYYIKITCERQIRRKCQHLSSNIITKPQRVDGIKYKSGEFGIFHKRKAFLILKQRTVNNRPEYLLIIKENKNQKSRAEKFLYYKLLFKHLYKWKEHTRQSLTSNIIPNQIKEEINFYAKTDGDSDSNSRSSLSSDENLTGSHNVTDKDIYLMQCYKYKLLGRYFEKLRSYSHIQNKKKYLEELLVDTYGERYILKPFNAWLCLMRYLKVTRRAILQLQRIMSRALLKRAFCKVVESKKFQRVPQRKPAGVILKQSHLLSKDRINNSRENILPERSLRIPNSNSENVCPQKTFKNYLTGVFPSKKESRKPLEQNNNILNLNNNETGTFSAYNISQILNNTIPQLHTDDSNLSLNFLNLDTSHFGGIESSGNRKDIQHQLYNQLRKPSDTQQIKILDHSLFGINGSKIEKENNPILNVTQNSTLKDSAIIQQKLHSKYFSSRVRQRSNFKSQSGASLIFQIPQCDRNSTSMIIERNEDIEDKPKVNKRKNPILKEFMERELIKESSYALKDRRRSRSTQTNLDTDTLGSEESTNRTNLSKEAGFARKEKLKKMVDDLQSHLKYLNGNLLNQKLMNKKLSSVKEQISTENSAYSY